MPITEQILITAKCDLCENTLTSATHEYIFEQGWREVLMQIRNYPDNDCDHDALIKTLCPVDFNKFKDFLGIQK